jgi:DNA-binding response OmpR family regulator
MDIWSRDRRRSTVGWVSTTVLLATGETGLRGLLERQLRDHGFEIAEPGGRADVVVAADAAELERLCAEAPVIVLGSVDDRPHDRVLAFRRGCDDYVPPPFTHEELVERIRAVLRRVRRAGAGPSGVRVLTVGALEIDEQARRVSIRGVDVKLSHKEFELLITLATEPERLFTRQELLRDIWDWPASMHTRTLDSHASRLRCKLRAVDPETAYVDNEWGVGYRLLGPLSRLGT